MSYDTVSKRIKDIMDRVDGVFNVHTYFRDIPDEAEFQKAFSVSTPNGIVLTAWMMTRRSFSTKRPTMDANALLDATHAIEIQGFYGLEDSTASEMKFQDIIDNIVQKFRTKFTLESESGTSLAGIIRVSDISVPEIGHGQFSNYFVHFCRVLLSVEERLQ